MSSSRDALQPRRWARAVTPLLHIGPGDMKMPHAVVDTAVEASELMRQGVVVVVPSADEAREVLRNFGADEGLIEFRIGSPKRVGQN